MENFIQRAFNDETEQENYKTLMKYLYFLENDQKQLNDAIENMIIENEKNKLKSNKKNKNKPISDLDKNIQKEEQIKSEIQKEIQSNLKNFTCQYQQLMDIEVNFKHRNIENHYKLLNQEIKSDLYGQLQMFQNRIREQMNENLQLIQQNTELQDSVDKLNILLNQYKEGEYILKYEIIDKESRLISELDSIKVALSMEKEELQKKIYYFQQKFENQDEIIDKLNNQLIYYQHQHIIQKNNLNANFITLTNQNQLLSNQCFQLNQLKNQHLITIEIINEQLLIESNKNLNLSSELKSAYQGIKNYQTEAIESNSLIVGKKAILIDTRTNQDKISNSSYDQSFYKRENRSLSKPQSRLLEISKQIQILTANPSLEKTIEPIKQNNLKMERERIKRVILHGDVRLSRPSSRTMHLQTWCNSDEEKKNIRQRSLQKK